MCIRLFLNYHTGILKIINFQCGFKKIIISILGQILLYSIWYKFLKIYIRIYNPKINSKVSNPLMTISSKILWANFCTFSHTEQNIWKKIVLHNSQFSKIPSLSEANFCSIAVSYFFNFSLQRWISKIEFPRFRYKILPRDATWVRAFTSLFARFVPPLVYRSTYIFIRYFQMIAGGGFLGPGIMAHLTTIGE